MSTTDQAYTNAKNRHEDAKKKLEDFEKGDEGLWLRDVRIRLRAGDNLNKSEGEEKERLEREEKELKVDVRDRLKQVELIEERLAAAQPGNDFVTRRWGVECAVIRLLFSRGIS
jgi:hypothetical protein